MTDLGPHLERLGLEQYLDAFLGEGFDSWTTLLDIQESDFDALNVKLGHRRKLQRAIAEHRGIPYERVIGTPSHDTLPEGVKTFEVASTGGGGSNIAPPETKRKYRRHPKADENAPERPPSAYVIFSNRIREEVKGDNLSFTEIAKLVGDRWQKLDPTGKEPYESQANSLKEQYNIQLSAYKKTEAYGEYMQYLAEFKAKYGGSAESKRPKLDPESSGGSASAKSLEIIPAEYLVPAQGHVRGGSIGSVSSLYSTTLPSPAGLTTSIMQSQSTTGMNPVPMRLPTGSSRGESPPESHYGREIRRLGQLSTQSSVSDESLAVRSESETVTRAAALSLSTPPSATPPLPSLLPSASMSEQSSMSETLQRLRYPSVPQHLPPAGLTTYSSLPPGSSVSYSQTSYPPSGSEGGWRNRALESRNYAEPPRRMAQTSGLASNIPHGSSSLPPLVMPERLSEMAQHTIGRTLPPPHASQPPQQLTSRIVTSAADFGRPEESIRRTPSGSGGASSQLENSENDAASTLAGLAAVGRHQSRSMSDPKQPRP